MSMWYFDHDTFVGRKKPSELASGRSPTGITAITEVTIRNRYKEQVKKTRYWHCPVSLLLLRFALLFHC
jgi:hypothetical protein